MALILTLLPEEQECIPETGSVFPPDPTAGEPVTAEIVRLKLGISPIDIDFGEDHAEIILLSAEHLARVLTL